MKKILVILTVLLSIGTYAQEVESDTKDGEINTLLKKEYKYGGFGAIEAKASMIGDDVEIFRGSRGGILINHQLGIGLGHYKMTALSPTNGIGLEDSALRSIKYSGVYVEYVLLPKLPVHLSFPVFIGGGKLKTYTGVSDVIVFDIDDLEDNYDVQTNKTTLFVVEPGVNIELNLLKNMRLGLGASYRYVTLLSSNNITTGNDLSDFAVNMSLKFGVF